MASRKSKVNLAPVSTRVDLCITASKMISETKEASYGPPTRNLNCAGELMKVVIQYGGSELPPGVFACLMMDQIKTARIVTGEFTRDTYLDKIGYTALAGELHSAEYEYDAFED